MKNVDDIIDELLENILQIKELVFGSGFEDFRTNRKAKIEITEKIQNLFEIYDDNIIQFKNIIPVEVQNQIYNIKKELLKNDSGISEVYIWQLCKKEIPIFEKQILNYAKNK